MRWSQWRRRPAGVLVLSLNLKTAGPFCIGTSKMPASPKHAVDRPSRFGDEVRDYCAKQFLLVGKTVEAKLGVVLGWCRAANVA
jgi:hypothetical protein